MWVGPARIETVFDIGSTRNSIDEEFLKQLFMEKYIYMHVQDVVAIEPSECSGMIEGSTFTTSKLAILDITFKEGNGGASETKRLGFVVLKNSSEDLLIGHPSFCELGYVLTKESITSRALGI